MAEELKGDELDAILDDLGRRMDRLRVLYEQFFLGIERIPPYQVQKDVVRILYRLQQAKLKGTSQKFRFQSLIQKFNAQKAYWSRTMREIEDGTYRRQAYRAERRRKPQDQAEGPELTSAEYQAVQMATDPLGEEAAAQAEAARRASQKAELADAAADFMSQISGSPREPAAAEPRKPAPEIRGMSADEIARKRAVLEEMRNRMRLGGARPAAAPTAPPPDADRAVFDRLVETKRRLNESVDSLNYDSVKKSLEQQREKVRAKHGVEKVDFDVVEKDGRAFLKPIPIKD